MTAALAFALFLQFTSILLAYLKQTRLPKGIIKDTPKVSILRPVCGLENNLEETLTSTFLLDYPDYEILFCVAQPNDPVVPLVLGLIKTHPQIPARLLIGNERISGNPKLNNLSKGWDAATSTWILMADSNVLLPRHTLQRLFSEWRADTGLVSSPPAGVRPIGFAARLECAFLNGFQGRWQLASAAMGNGFAQGKMLFWHRDLLDQAGGLAALGQQMAEDVAATKLVRAAGRKVRLTSRLFEQPIGSRRFAAVWGRQLRWSKVRRLGFVPLFLCEIIAGGAVPIVTAVSLMLLNVIAPHVVVGFAALWYGAEYLLAKWSGWPATAADVLAWICRDALLPALWIAAWFGNGFEWRGTAMHTENGPAVAKP